LSLLCIYKAFTFVTSKGKINRMTMEPESKVNGKQKKRKDKAFNLKKVKRYLSKNDVTEIALEVGVQPRTVSNHIHHTPKMYPNALVIEKILERAERNKALRQRVENL